MASNKDCSRKQSAFYITALAAMIILLALSGCSYRYYPEELESIDIYHKTTLDDWSAGIFSKNDTINFRTEESSFENEIDYKATAIDISEILNSYDIGLARHKADENCTVDGIDPGYLIIRYRVGTVLIEEDLCNETTEPMQAYNDILQKIS